MNELINLEKILTSFLGESKSGLSDNSQLQYCCPQCAEDDGVESDGKFNLEVNLLKGKYRCWKCEVENEMHGKISSLIKKYGNESILFEFRNEINNIKKSKEYEFNLVENDLFFEDEDEFIITLPENTYDFKFDGNKNEEVALKYLTDRGMGEYLIKKHNLKYTNYYCSPYVFRNRIIIPSYDKYGVLNYYTGRDYTGKVFRKYYNCEKSSKKDIVFNEKFINWDADIVLVEGPTDHIVVPNSIPLLGKSLNLDFYLFKSLIEKSTQNIIIFLDNDATADAIEICRRLTNINLCGRLRIVPTEKIRLILCENKTYSDNKLDPNKLHEKLGYKGISWALKQSEEYDCF